MNAPLDSTRFSHGIESIRACLTNTSQDTLLIASEIAQVPMRTVRAALEGQSILPLRDWISLVHGAEIAQAPRSITTMVDVRGYLIDLLAQAPEPDEAELPLDSFDIEQLQIIKEATSGALLKATLILKDHGYDE